MVTRLGGVLGAAAAIVSVLANLGCCGLGVASGATAVAMLGGLMGSLETMGYGPLYASLGLTLTSLRIRAWRRGRALPLRFGLLGGLALVLAFHEAWDVAVFRTLVWGGVAALGAAVASDAGFASRSCWPRPTERC